MNPLIRFHSIILFITTFVVFLSWNLLIKLSVDYPLLLIPLAGVLSIGFYRVFLIIFKLIILKCRCLKKFVFGAYYVEGVWVGFFIGKANKVRFYAETYEQDFESIVMRGKGFRDDEGHFGSWIAENVNINIKKGTLNYTYETDPFDDTFMNSGLANFIIERNTIDSPPHKLIGFSADLYNPKKLKSCEIKVNDKPCIGNIEDALSKAKVLYEAHKKYFHIVGDIENTDMVNENKLNSELKEE